MSAPSSAGEMPGIAIALLEQVHQVKKDWDEGAPPDAATAVRQRPELAADKAAVLDLAVEEYFRRRDAGEEVDAAELADRFPTYRTSIFRVLCTQDLLSDLTGPLPLEPVHWPGPGDQVGDLTLVRELGRGTFARAFLATESSTGGRPVVVKLSLGGDAEAHTLGRLNHLHVVPILSCRRDPESCLTAVCMPFLGSATLEDVLDFIGRSSPPSARVILEAVRSTARPGDPEVEGAEAHPRLLRGRYAEGVLHLGLQLAEALAFLHVRGISHQDLKPTNVLLGPDGCPRLLDFNLALDAGSGRERLGGTLPYMAPEQVRAWLGTDRQSRRPGDKEKVVASGSLSPGLPLSLSLSVGLGDVYALGVILYELLTGRHPFGPVAPRPPDETEAAQLLARQAAGAPPLQVPGLDAPVRRLLERCLALEPTQRPTSAELAAGLRTFFSAIRRLRRWTVRHRVALVSAAVLLPLAAVGFGRLQPSPYEAGRTAFRAGHYEEAERHFSEALAADPNDARSRLARGCTRLKRSLELTGLPESDMLKAAMDDFQPTGAVGWEYRAYCDARRQDPRAAIAWADEAEKAGRRTTALLNNRAACRLERYDLDAAQRDLAAIDARDRDLAAVCYNRVLLALKRCRSLPAPLLPDGLLDDVQRLLESGQTDRHVHLWTAHAFAWAAQDQGYRIAALQAVVPWGGSIAPLAAALAAGREDYAHKALKQLRLAVEAGIDSQKLGAISLYFPPLSAQPQYQALQRLPALDQVPPDRHVQLIDPVTDLPE